MFTIRTLYNLSPSPPPGLGKRCSRAPLLKKPRRDSNPHRNTNPNPDRSPGAFDRFQRIDEAPRTMILQTLPRGADPPPPPGVVKPPSGRTRHKG